MLTKNVFRSLTLATVATLAATSWVVEASALTLISSCPQTLNKAGETYYFAADLRASGSCVTVAADRVTIDFKDHTITGDGSGALVTDGGVARVAASKEVVDPALRFLQVNAAFVSRFASIGRSP